MRIISTSLVVLILLFSVNSIAQKHASILIEPGIYLKKGATAGGGSVNFGARIAGSLFHPGFGLNWIFEKKSKPSLNVNLLLCDDKAVKISPFVNLKGGINLYSERVATTQIIGGLFIAGNIGVFFPSKVSTKIGVSVGFTEINYKSKTGSTTLKSKSDFFNISATVKI